jgi:hypothetical protein
MKVRQQALLQFDTCHEQLRSFLNAFARRSEELAAMLDVTANACRTLTNKRV